MSTPELPPTRQKIPDTTSLISRIDADLNMQREPNAPKRTFSLEKYVTVFRHFRKLRNLEDIDYDDSFNFGS